MDQEQQVRSAEPTPHPVNITIPRQERYSRWLALGTLLFAIPKIVMLIPHFIVIYVLSIAAFFAAVIAQVAVLFTGRYPEALHRFVVGVLQWQMRVNAFFIGLSDRYPPFSLS